MEFSVNNPKTLDKLIKKGMIHKDFKNHLGNRTLPGLNVDENLLCMDIFDLLITNGGKTIKDIKVELNITHKEVIRCLKLMKECGLVIYKKYNIRNRDKIQV